MTAFCVFGITEPLARKSAEAASKTWLAKMSSQERAEVTAATVDAWIRDRTAEMLKNGKPKQVSAAFDAPQFAEDWIALAKRTVKARGLRVMVRGEKTDRHGATVISKRTKRPVIAWVPYQP
ncbi:hypothetical protein CEG14_05545 [Bordetella genomosp. 1]|uniref:Uncharacterized protein n=1 Tax=Bordetella genomosp. 1 TaxID=1395607 RepID=A0A261SQ94_9BORD|nr:hypothetical protein [Bordetella genomosp. 1]OZI39000.1 hypothetical protein CEG14_05545 [Bordetella genomosp. 1]